MPRLIKPRLQNGAAFQTPRGPAKAVLEKANVT
jgi:hypothetical protein